MRKSLGTLLCVLLLLAARPTLAIDEGRVEGRLIYKGKPVRFEHVLVVRYGNEEGTAQGPHLRIFLSDREIPLALASTVTLYSLRQTLHAAGGNAVLLKADPRGRGKKARVELLSAAELPWPILIGTIPDVFTHLALGDKRLSGSIVVRQDEVDLSAVFDAPVMEHVVTARFDGKAARSSAPALALIACTAAARNGDLDTLGKCVGDFDREEFEHLWAEGGAKNAKLQPTAAEFARTIRRVVVRGENATVMTGGDFVEMVLENGIWKIKG